MRVPARRRRSYWQPAIGIVVMIAAIGLLLWASGVLNPGAVKKRIVRAGTVPVPVAATTIKAYSKVTRDHLIDVKNQEIAVVYLPKSALRPEMITDLAAILGRVVGHDKAPGYVFTEADFLPKGTRPGLVAGIPAGKRAMRLEAEKVQGLFGLLPGDRFDIVATLPIDEQIARSLPSAGGLYGKQIDLEARLQNLQKQATVRVIVQNGVVVEPVSVRQAPVFSRTLTQGAVTRTRPIQEIVVAVDPEEVAPLSEAIALEAQVTCVPRSGRPDDPSDSRTPSLSPRNPMVGTGQGSRVGMIETITGDKREMIAAPARPETQGQ